jgi:hypothetical protein
VTSGSGIDNVYINAKWLARVTASYTLPWQDIGLAAFWNGRSGYPQPLNEQTPSRANSAGTANVYLQPLGDFRLPNFQNLDARIEKPIKLGRGARLTVSMDVFNVFNDSTVLSQRGVQNASNANLISSLVAPRVIRFGAHMSW